MCATRALSGPAVEGLRVAALADLERGGDVHLEEPDAALACRSSHRVARRAAWRDQADDDDAPWAREEQRHLAGASDVLVAVLVLKPRSALTPARSTSPSSEAPSRRRAAARRGGAADVVLPEPGSPVSQTVSPRVGVRHATRSCHPLRRSRSGHQVSVSSLHAVAALDAIFKAYDMRGTYPDQLDEATCRAVGSAFATFAKAPKICIARDMRPSGVALAAAFADGARACGTEVVDLGMGSTDFLYFASGHLDCARRDVHRVAQPRPVQRHQALPRGREARGGGERARRDPGARRAGSSTTPAVGVRARRSSTWTSSRRGRTTSGRSSTRRCCVPLHVVADTANGMGGLVAPLVFDPLPFEVDYLYQELDGTFPNHPADPIQPENLVDLQAKVREHGCGRRPRVRRRRRPRVPHRRARRGRLGLAHDRARRRRRCSRGTPARRCSTTSSARRSSPRS